MLECVGILAASYIKSTALSGDVLILGHKSGTDYYSFYTVVGAQTALNIVLVLINNHVLHTFGDYILEGDWGRGWALCICMCAPVFVYVYINIGREKEISCFYVI